MFSIAPKKAPDNSSVIYIFLKKSSKLEIEGTFLDIWENHLTSYLIVKDRIVYS